MKNLFGLSYRSTSSRLSFRRGPGILSCALACLVAVGLTALNASAQGNGSDANNGTFGTYTVTNAPSANSLPATPSDSFFTSVQNYFTSFNTNLDSTFGTETAELATGVDSIQGGSVPLANHLRFSYNAYKALSVESVTRSSGVAGTFVSEQIGLGLNFIVHDARLTLYGDAGYDFIDRHDKYFGEAGLRVSKALTSHTAAGIAIGAQFPANRQVFSVFTVVTF